ncbi:amidohydrolase [Candidatus Pacearchaeota archaeon]|nr:amidohydrolase [Candidatus Pacearchaeota archaeon]
MIIDVHSHAWKYPEHFTQSLRDNFKRARKDVEVDLTTNYRDYLKNSSEKVRTIVFGGKARQSGLWVDDEYVADYVKQYPENLIGFLSLDPTQKNWKEEMKHGHLELGLKGIKLMPMYAGFNPNDKSLNALWEYATENNLPVLLHTGTNVVPNSQLEYTFPRHIDGVAISFPGVKIIMAHLSHPFENECIAVIRKQPNVYADVSALHYRPYQLYNSLMLVQEYCVWDKLLFGTDYPFTNVNDSVRGLKELNEKVGAKIKLDETEIENLIHRDAFSLLGLE